MKLAIVDDDKHWREDAYRIVITHYRNTNIEIDLFESGIEFIEKEELYDIVLMDIEMPNKDGFKTISEYKLLKDDCIVIILTTHTESANKGYLVNAFRYIDKANMESELIEALSSSDRILASNDSISLNAVGLGNLNLIIKDIMFIKTYKRNIMVYTTDNKYECSDSIAELELKLEPYGFFRSHRSCLISLDKVKNFDRRDVFFANGNTAYLSSRKYKEMKERYLERKINVANK